MPSSVSIRYYSQGRHVMEHLIDHDNRLISVRPIAACYGEEIAGILVDALNCAQNEEQIPTHKWRGDGHG